MSRITCTLLSLALLGAVALGADKPDQKAADSGTAIEFSKPLPKANFRGTVGYGRTEQEAPFLARVNEEPIDLWAGTQVPPAQGEKPDPKKEAADKAEREKELRKADAYRLADQAGKYVGWFGIVRGVSRNQSEGRTDLLVEHKYFDGLVDPDLQIVSVYGAGDFTASLRAEADKIPMLSLVRVYGKVSKAEDGIPRVEADYVRVWDWGLFTFMDYGPDHTNPKWLAIRKLSGSEVYNSRPTTEFYGQVLGKREDAKATQSPAKE